MKPNYYTIEQMLEMIDEPNRMACQRILADNRQLFQTVQGSTNNHQNWSGGYFDHIQEIWSGGYFDHIQEIMNIAVVLYEGLNSARLLPFSLSDLLLVVYLHDVEKPWKYELRDDGQLHHKSTMQNKEDHQSFRMKKLAEYGVVFTSEQENGMKYAEGELDDYSSRRRVMGPLACVAHMCDVCSARLWFVHPMVQDDPWSGAVRIRD